MKKALPLSSLLAGDLPLTGRSRVSEAYDHARSRYVWHLCDAVLTAPVAPPSAPAEQRRSVTRTYHRAQRVINKLAAMLPRSFARLRGFLLDPARVPFVTHLVGPLSAGSGVTVFVMDPARGPQARVLKVYRKSLGRRLDVLLDQAEDRRMRYHRVAGWYKNCGVVLPTHFLLLHNPMLGLRALAYVQPYVDGAPVDLFTDLSEQALIQLLVDDRTLRKQFSCFVERTLDVVAVHEECVDIVGRNNLVIIRCGGQHRLVLLDYGILSFTLNRNRRHTLDELRSRLEYLARIDARIRDAEIDDERHGEPPCRQFSDGLTHALST